jgi:hypothetical protein
MIIRPGKVAHGKCVFFRRLSEEIDSGHAAGAGHVLDDHCGISRNVLGQRRATIRPSISVGPPAAKLIRKVIFFPW